MPFSARSFCRRPVLGALAAVAALLGASPAHAAASDLGDAQLLIAGTRLTVSPESQTVPFDTPTLVETHLEGFDVANGSLPADLRVLADFTGPEVDGVMVLETVPNEPLRIPRLRLEGEYRLDNIRLAQGDELLAYAHPQSSAIRVTQILITKVTSRPLSLDEIRSYGIVVDDDSFKAFNFTFGFGVEGDVLDYNVPVLFVPGNDKPEVLFGGASGGHSPRFRPPPLTPFTLEFQEEEIEAGGCENPLGDCTVNLPPPLPGVILFPTDIGLLNQFFSVVLMVQNGAPEGDPLVIRDLTAKIELPPGLRQAETEPPTPLGVPVPVRVPGPDGELGTADDVTFLIAQATGEAEFLVEGLREGTHVVDIAMEGVLEGLPGGIRRVAGTARGAVVVRDPTFGVTITHPDVVRRDEEYSLYLTLANTSNAPANLVTVSLPRFGLSGVEPVGETKRTIDTLLPGDSEVLEFRLRSLRTGRVTAASVRSDQHVNPTFELTVGVGENGIPLSPTEIILPRSTEELPAGMVRQALNLIGLGFSLATAPPSLLNSDLPRVGRAAVDERVYQLAQAGRHTRFGEDLFDTAAVLAAEWNGVRDRDWDWDTLRRTTQKGSLFGDSLGQVFAAEAAATSSRAAFERFAATTAYLPPVHGALASDGGSDLEVASRTSGKRLYGSGIETDRVRDLPFADLYDLGAGRMALLAVPEEGGYEVRLSRRPGAGSGSADLELLVPGADGALRTVRWTGVSLLQNGQAVVEYLPGDETFTLAVDRDGDGVADDRLPGTLGQVSPRAFTAVAAVQNAEVDPTGHILEVLFSGDVDLTSLVPRDPARFFLPDKVSNGGLIPAEADLAHPLVGTIAENPFAGLRNSRVVRVVFNNPVSPYVEHELRIRDVSSPAGEHLAEALVPVETTVTMPGTLVAGRVIGPDGEPAPFAEVELVETDQCPVCIDSCRAHRTAAVRADANGEFLFDYVRQTPCGDLFTLRATDLESAKKGRAAGRVRFIGETVRLNVVMLGRGTIRGSVRYDDGTVPSKLRVLGHSPAFQESRYANIGEDGAFEVGDLPVGTISLTADDSDGSFATTTVEIPTAGAVVQRDLVILRRPEDPTGELGGTVYAPDGATPVADAWVALYSGGDLVGSRRSGLDGSFDFGIVPAGQAEIEAFSGETHRSGARMFFEIQADTVNRVEVLLRDEVGTVEGTVFRETLDGVLPVSGAVVWAAGTPFNSVSDAQGRYRLEGVFAGTQTIRAADLDAQETTQAQVTVEDGTTAQRDLVFRTPADAGGIAGQVLDYAGNPVFGATVHLELDDQHWFREEQTDASGRFTIEDLKAGVYTVHAFRGDDGGTATTRIEFAGDTPFVTIRFKKGTIRGVVKARNESGELVGVRSVIRYRTTTVRLGLVGLDVEPHDVETAEDGTFEIPDALVGDYVLTAFNAFHGQETVSGELVSHGEVAEHEIVFEINGTISGTVLDHDGVTPAAGARVTMKHPGFGDFDLTADQEGRFTFELVPPAGRTFPIQALWEDGMVFRQGQVWVRFDRFGQELDVEIVLPRQGTVSGRVEDSNGDPVTGAVVTLKESEYPGRTLTRESDASGAFSYSNVFEGVSTLSARAPHLGSLGGKTTVEIETEGQEVAGAVIRLQDVGEITGRVLSPVDGQPVPSAEVRLYRGGLFDSGNSDDLGEFRFTLLPLGTYEVRVLDPATGRAGSSGAISVSTNGDVVFREVFLEARGAVDGHLYEPASTVPVPGSTVTLRARSEIAITTYSSTDAEGYFEFLGIPQGEFTLTARERDGRRRASGGGEITREGERFTLDLFLEESGFVAGTVLNPPGLPAGPFSPANVRVVQDGQVIGSSLESEYRFGGIIAERTFRLEATEPGGLHRGRAEGVLSSEGEEVRVDVPMHAIGAARVSVVDSFGNPVPGADVRLTSHGFYGGQTFAGSTGADHVIEFQDVGAGDLAAFASDTVSQLGGSATGTLELEGQLAELTVALQDSAEVRGVVLLADGSTPAADALVVYEGGGNTYRQAAEADGSFSFPSVPLGSFTLTLQESFGPGTLRTTGSTSANGEVLDLGALVLDDRDPEVVEIVPADGALGVPVEAAVTVRFSEPLDREAFRSTWVTLRRTGAGGVTVDHSWSDGDATLTLTPRDPLASFTSYQVKVSTSVLDPAGRSLAQAVQTGFTTADVVPPAVVAVSPADGAVQVPVDVQIAVQLSEPVVAATLSGSAIQLTDQTAGTGVTTTFTLQPSERDVLVTPVDPLVEDHAYSLAVQGVQDRAGNVMAPFTSGFRTVDPTPPTVALTVPEGPLAEGVAVELTATAVDSPDLVSVSFFAGGTLISTDGEAPYAASYAPTAADADAGSVELSASGVDLAGNVGPPAVVTREVTADLPPEVELAVEPASGVLPEGTVRVQAEARDASGIAKVELLVTGAVTDERIDRPGEGTTLWPVDESYEVPLLPDVRYVEAVVRAEDRLGKVTESDPVRIEVLEDLEAPVFGLVEPPEGTEVTSGDAVTFRADVTDNVRVAEVRFRFAGQSFTDSAEPFEWTVPAPAVSSSTDLPAEIEAEDALGNVAALTRTLRVEPTFDPDRPTVALVCPSDGALLAPGTGLDVVAQAADDQAVEKVEFFLGDASTPATTDFEAPYTFRLEAPPEAVAGDVLALRAVASDFGGKSAEARSDVRVVEGALVTEDTVVTASDASFDGGDLVVQGATLTVEGRHAFDDLAVLEGGVVTHAATAPGAVERLEIDLTGDLFVSCGGAVDATGRGFPAGHSYPGTGEGIFVADDFNDRDLAGWQVVDEGEAQGPSSWSASSGSLIQSSNIHSQTNPELGLGTYLLWQEGVPAPDYRLNFWMQSTDNDGLGAMFRYLDASNYYRFVWYHEAGYRRLEKVEGGIVTVLAEDDVLYAGSTWYRIALVADGPRLELWIDGERIFSVEDGSHPSGTVALYSFGNAGSYFEDVQVTDLTSSSIFVGGSHGGRGGGADGTNPAYGSLFDPADPGAGSGGIFGPAGGGVVRIAAVGRAVIDGQVAAAGGTSSIRSGGAGGSIRLDAETLGGSGRIDASGGAAVSDHTAGGGGRVALYGAFIEPGLLSRTLAAGGDAGSPEARGGAGTIIVRRDGQPLGDLILDNAGRETVQVTELFPVGEGILDTVEPGAVTDDEADFRHSLVGAEVELGSVPDRLFPVTAHEHHGTRMELETGGDDLTGLTAAGDTYRGVYRFDRVAVVGGARAVAPDEVRTSTVDVDAASVWAPGYRPSVVLTSPVAGAVFDSGDPIAVEAAVDNLYGFDSVVLRAAGVERVVETAPYTTTVTAPPVAEATAFTAEAEVADHAGNHLVASVPVTVEPNQDVTPPVVVLDPCPRDGDVVVPGVPLALAFQVSDDDLVERYRLVVDGVVEDEVTGVDQATAAAELTWTPPAGAAPGTAFALAVEAVDYGGNVGSAAVGVVTPTGAVLTGDQILDSSRNGQDVTLGAGTFTATDSLDLASLTLLGGARLTADPAAGRVDLTVQNTARVQCGAVVDVSAQGFRGGHVNHTSGYAPEGLVASATDAGGSHGGTGIRINGPGPAGEVYDSVYVPELSGGGGSIDNNTSSQRGGNGGGVVRIEAGSLVLEGEILARGESRPHNTQGAGGAGGSVTVVVGGPLSGSGRIDVSGGSSSGCGSSLYVGSGGGGRVSLRVGSLTDFDPGSQVESQGGVAFTCGTPSYAAPGTVWVLEDTGTYGDLWVDAGLASDGTERIGPPTALPALGSGAVVAAEASGADLWVTGESAFRDRWLGAWMVLVDGSGAELGAFRVSTLDAAGRALLEEAGAAADGASYRGEYRFDAVTLENGAGLTVDDHLEAGSVLAAGSSRLPSQVDIRGDVTVASDARISLARGSALRMTVGGTFTVEADGALDLSAQGYLGGHVNHTSGYAPETVLASGTDAGGSHGGAGIRINDPGPVGEVYDSVFVPELSGGGGSIDNNSSSLRGGNGGGAVRIEAGAVELEGEILARGESRPHNSQGAGGAGGSLALVVAGSLSGSGRIDVSGGSSSGCGSTLYVGSGGGGRVSLRVGSLLGFDPATQVVSQGGVAFTCGTPHHAAPGTTYVLETGATHGDLHVDQGGTDGLAVPHTVLPTIGSGTVGASEADAEDPDALWIEPQDPDALFSLGVIGMWVRVDGSDYRVIDQTVDRRRLLLAGAAGLVAPGDPFEGVYKLDTVFVSGGAVLEFLDPVEAGDFVVDGDSQVIQP